MRYLLAVLILAGLAFSQTPAGPIPASFFGQTLISPTNYPTVTIGNMGKESAAEWGYIEPNAPVGGGCPGTTNCTHTYNWATLDSYVSTAASHGVAFMWTWDYAPSWATGGVGCGTPATCTGNITDLVDMDAFITALVTRYNGANGHGTIQAYETGNEVWSSGDFTGTTAQLATIINRLVIDIRAANAGAKVGPIGESSPDFYYVSGGKYDQLFAAGLTTTFDFISFHGYPHHSDDSPEYLTGSCVPTGGSDGHGELDCVKQMMSRNAISASIPIWMSEGSWGDNAYTNCINATGGGSGVTGCNTASGTLQSAFVSRYLLELWSAGAVSMNWYAWDNAGWGSLSSTAKTAWQQTYNWMVGNTMVSPCAIVSGTVWTCGLTSPNGSALVVWNSAGSSSYAPAAQYKTYSDLTGATTAISGPITIGIAPLLLVGPYTTTSPAPASVVFYAGNPTSVTPQRLPMNVMSHLATNSDVLAANALTGGQGGGLNLAVTVWATPGSDDLATPLWYSGASDPYFNLTGCTYTPTISMSPFRAPTNAPYSNTWRTDLGYCNDGNIRVWDQSTGAMVGGYECINSLSPPAPSIGAGGTIGSPGAFAVGSGCGASKNAMTDKDWDSPNGWLNTQGAEGSANFAPMAGIVRGVEMTSGQINHALILGISCVDPYLGSPTVFPDISATLWACASTPNMPPAGALIFLDYTDAQIAAMSIPQWQKTLLTAMSHYGGYVSITAREAGGGAGFQHESGMPYQVATGGTITTKVNGSVTGMYVSGGTKDPVFTYLQTTEGLPCNSTSGTSDCKYTLQWLNNVPNVGGTSITSHVHMAAPCVALGMAGQAGGCLVPWTGIIAPGRAIDWSQAGATIVNRTTICSTLSAGASAATINAAIAACPSGDVVLLNPGTYNLSAALVINNNNVTLRGSGANLTFLIFSNGVSCGLGSSSGNLCIVDNTAYYNGSSPVLPPSGTHQMKWTAGFAQGTTIITGNSCGSGCTAPTVGQSIILDQADDASDTGGIFLCGTSSCNNEGASNFVGRVISGTDYSQQQIVKVTSISGSGTGPYTIGITPGLYATNWAKGSTNGIWWPGTISGVGIENLSLDATANTSGAGIITTFYDCLNCWYSGVRSVKPGGTAHVLLSQSAHVTVQNSYMFGSPGAQQSYGAEIWETCDSAVQNNIFQQVASPSAAANGCGNVWAYNFSIDNLFSSPSWMQVTYSAHNAGAMYNLYEGNELNGLDNDDDWGTAPLNSYFRNRSAGVETVSGLQRSQNTIAHRLDWGSRGFNLIGNVLGTSGFDTTYETSAAVNGGSTTNGWLSVYVLGYRSIGSIPFSTSDPLVRSTLMRWGNYDTVNATVRWDGTESSPAAAGSGATQVAGNATPASQTLPASFYLSAKPTWFKTLPYPPIGPDVAGGNIPNVGGHAYQIPAEVCYFGLTGATSDGTGGVLPFNPASCYAGNPVNIAGSVTLNGVTIK